MDGVYYSVSVLFTIKRSCLADIGFGKEMPLIFLFYLFFYVIVNLALFCHAGLGRVAECNQPGKNSMKCSATAENRTRATERTDSETHSIVPLS